MTVLQRPPQYVLASILCSFGGFLFGMDTGIIGPVTVMNGYTTSFGTVSSVLHGLIVSAILVPAAISSFFAGRVADVLGRHKAISLGAFIFGLGATLEAGALHLAMFIVGRVVEGIGEGLYLGTLVVYICEISPPSKRGALTSTPQLLVTMGLCVGFFICYGSARFISSLSWRLPFIVLSVLAFSFSVASLRLTPSPRWLLLRGRSTEAAAAWDSLGVSHAEREKIERLEETQQGILSDPGTISLSSQVAGARPGDQASSKRHSFWGLFSRDVRAQTFLALFLMGMQQLSGIDGVLYYAPLLFQQAGLSSAEASFLASGVSALVIFGATIPALIWADSWGRRQSTIFGGVGLGIAMFLIGSLYAAHSVHGSHGAERWIVIVSIYLFAIIYSLSWGVGIKIYAAEIQPQRTRAAATSLAHGSNWSTNFLVALTTPILMAKSSYGAYFLFGGCSFLTACVCAVYMPETKGRSLEEIDAAFKKTSISRSQPN